MPPKEDKSKASTSRPKSRSRSKPKSRSRSKSESRSRSRSKEADTREADTREAGTSPYYREGNSILSAIQSIPARRFSITPTGSRRTRHRTSTDDMETVLHWTDDYDAEFTELVILWADKQDKRPLSKNNMPIYYRIINTLLLLLQFRGEQDRLYFAEDIASIKSAAAEIDFEIDTDSIIKNLIQNTLNVFDAVNGFPKASTIDVIIEDRPSVIILYHGFKHPNAPIIQKLKALKPGEIFIMPIFLSTSVLLDVACRFSGSAKLLLRINVPETHFDKCPYAYLGTSLVIGNTNSYGEHEILLNLFTKLKFIETTQETIAYRIPQVLGNPLEKTELFTVYIMEFHNISSKTIHQVNKDLVTLVNEYIPARKP